MKNLYVIRVFAVFILLVHFGCTTSADKKLEEATQFFAEKKYNKALALIDTILKETPDSLPAQRLKSLSLIEQGSLSAALDAYERVEKTHPEIAHPLLKEISLAVIKKSLTDENFFVRSAAVKAVGETGDPALIPLIVPSMRDKAMFVRFFSVEAFGQLGGPDALKLIMAAKKDPEGMVRVAAVKVLADLKKEERAGFELNNLLGIFKDDSDITVRLFALAAMSKEGDEKSLTKLIKEVKALKGGARASGVAALGRSQNPASIPLLKAYLSDTDKAIRMYAAEATGEIASIEFYEDLLLTLDDEDTAVRGAAATSLGKLGDPRAIPVLEKKMGDPDAMVRISVAEGLKRLGKEKIEIYRKTLTDADYGVRHFAIGSLRRNWGEKGIPLLTRFLKDEAPRVRIAAIRALGEVGALKELPLITQGLKDHDNAVRTYAAGNVIRIINKSAGMQFKKPAGE